MESVGRLVPFLLLDSPDLQIAAPALETVPSQVADGAQALKRAYQSCMTAARDGPGRSQVG